MAVEEDGTEDGLSLEMGIREGTGPVDSEEMVSSENTDSVVWLEMSVIEVSIGKSVTSVGVAVALALSMMLVTISGSSDVEMSKSMEVEGAPVVPGPVMPSIVDVGASVTVGSSSPLAVLVTISSSRVIVGAGVLVGSSSAVEVSVTTAVEETPVPLPVSPDLVGSNSEVGVALLVSFSEVKVGSSEDVRTPDGPNVISLSVLVFSSSSSLADESLNEVALLVGSSEGSVLEGSSEVL